VTAAAERVTGRQLVKPGVFRKLGLISGVLLAMYVAVKAIDTLVWLNITSPSLGFGPRDYYSYWPISSTFLFAVTVPLGLFPALLLIMPITAGKRGWLLLGATLACAGVLLNRFVFTVQTLALPTLAFDDFLQYSPSWQEVATFGGVIAYGVIVYSLSYRYLPLFDPPKGADPNVSVD